MTQSDRANPMEKNSAPTASETAPVKNRRIHLGIVVLLFLGVLFVFAYALKREYWKDLH